MFHDVLLLQHFDWVSTFAVTLSTGEGIVRVRTVEGTRVWFGQVPFPDSVSSALRSGSIVAYEVYPRRDYC